MSTLSARYVRKPRRQYVCDYCERSINGSYIRLYGSADNEKPWTLRLHARGACRPGASDPKVASALRAADEDEGQHDQQ